MAPSIRRRSQRLRTARRTSTAEDNHGGGRGRRTSKTVSDVQSIAKKEMVMYSDAPCLPQEIITDILKRLPVKSLIRFRCVCKYWKNLVKTPSFIAEHLRHSTQQIPFLLFERRGIKRNPCLINRDMQVLEFQTPPFIDSSMGNCCIVGSSNGLLCLKLRESESFFLWNPAIREVLEMPKVLNLHGLGISAVGFGFSPISSDYKIVRLFVSGLDDDRTYLVEVFSLRTRSWKEVEVGKLEGIMPFVRMCGFTFDGAIFWFGFELAEPNNISILSFDIATEAFTLIPFPRSARVSDYSRLTTYENKLAMISKSRVEDRLSSINLWVMEKRGERWIWTKTYTSNPFPACLSSAMTVWRDQIFWGPHAYPQFFSEAKGAVDTDEKLVLCHLHTNEFKTLSIGKCPIMNHVWNYVESLVSVGNIHTEASSS